MRATHQYLLLFEDFSQPFLRQDHHITTAVGPLGLKRQTGDPNPHQGSLCPQTPVAVSQVLLQQRHAELPEVNASLEELPSAALSPVRAPCEITE